MSIVFHLLDQYLGLAPADWVATFKAADELNKKEAAETQKKQTASRAADSKPSLPLEKYAGVYKDAWYGSATISFENGRLTLTFDQTPGMMGNLEALAVRQFQDTLAQPIHPRRFRYLRAQTRRQHRSLQDGGGVFTRRLQLRLSGPVL